MTLTYPALNRARRVLWLVTGDNKPAMLAKLRAGDRTIPAGRIRADLAEVFADAAAARGPLHSSEGASTAPSEPPQDPGLRRPSRRSNDGGSNAFAGLNCRDR